MSAVPPVTIVLVDGITVQDLARALTYTGLAVSNTDVSPNLFKINRVERRLPKNVVEFEPPAFLRRQAD